MGPPPLPADPPRPWKNVRFILYFFPSWTISSCNLYWCQLAESFPDISEIYEDGLADSKLKNVGKKLRLEFDNVQKLNKYITPSDIANQRKKFRSSVMVRNIYTEVLNILQAVVMKKLSKKGIPKKHKKYLDDSMMTSIAGIAAAMKNSG